MKAIIDLLNVVYDEKEKRSFVKLNLLFLLFTLIAILSLMIALAAVVIAPMVFSRRWSVVFPEPRHRGATLATLQGSLRQSRWQRSIAMGRAASEPRWQWLSVGSVAAAIGWLITSVLFSWYIAHFGAYNATYGSLGMPSSA